MTHKKARKWDKNARNMDKTHAIKTDTQMAINRTQKRL